MSVSRAGRSAMTAGVTHDPLDPAVLQAQVEALGPWFHDMDLAGVRTAPDHFLHGYPGKKWAAVASRLPADLAGCSVLDIGCNAGFHSFDLKRRGAGRVLGIDHDARYLAQARLAAEVLGADVEFRQMEVWDVAQLGERFDLVLFMGVFYHLRHPLLALDLLHAHVVGDRLLFQTMLRGSPDQAAVAVDYAFFEDVPVDAPGWPRIAFIEQRFAGDPTNWWLPNRAGAEAMLRAAGFGIETQLEAETWLCRHRPLPPGASGAVYPSAGSAE